eukprot:TRINITY_DN15470_c0_g3_i1.p2 TRINITY_DN15470_c0_g3~~TRINITY_DN15470_c0_g3_i1.p2  ORF type:complete len:122 (-),score=12.05 TRINITY_DN15470_c0_g3_i1:631-996(-)
MSSAMASSRIGAQEATAARGWDSEPRHTGITHLSFSDVENNSHTFAVEQHESLSPRSDSSFGSATSTSSFDDPLASFSETDNFWLREDRDADANFICEKFTFLHIASAQPNASRRSRSSPC